MKKVIPWILVALFLASTIFLLCRKETTVSTQKVTTKVDTLRDTTKIPAPHLITKIKIRNDTMKLSDTVNDTIPYVKDSMIYIPISQKTYLADSYKGYISGYDARLDSLTMYPKSTTSTKVVTVTKKNSKWGIGVSAGYGISKNGLSPYVGVGVIYNIFK